MALPPQPMSYFGEPGSFSEVAASKRFPKSELVSSPTAEEAFAGLKSGKYSRIIVPIENASSGSIINTADELMSLAKSDQGSALKIREALAMRIRLMLLARSDTAEISEIYSHRAPFDHSRNWLKRHYPKAQQIIVPSTSKAAFLAALKPGTAAIAGAQAVDQYKLKIISSDVGAEVANQTTFIVVGTPIPRPLKPTHTNLVFELSHRPGSLVAVLQVLAKRRLNLTKILSRPIPGHFEEYRFMIEFNGAEPTPIVKQALDRIRKITTFCAVIGAYPVRRI